MIIARRPVLRLAVPRWGSRPGRPDGTFGEVLRITTARECGDARRTYRSKPKATPASTSGPARDGGLPGDASRYTGGGGAAEEPPGKGPSDGGLSPARQRYLKGQCPESIAVGKPFSLVARIVSSGPASARLKPFDVPPEGRDVLLVVHAPGLQVLGDQRLTVRVPADGDSEPVMFELLADAPGPRSVSRPNVTGRPPRTGKSSPRYPRRPPRVR